MVISLFWAARLCSKQKRNYFQNSIFAESMTWRTRFRDTQQDSLSYARENERTLQKSTERLAGEAGEGDGEKGGGAPHQPQRQQQKTARLTWNNKSDWYSCFVYPQPHSAMWRLPAPSLPRPRIPRNHPSTAPFPPPNAPIHVSLNPPSPPPPPHLVNEHIAPSRCESENRFSGPGSGRHINDFNEPRAIHPHILSSRNRTFRYDVCITGGLTSRTDCFTHTKNAIIIYLVENTKIVDQVAIFFCDYIFVYLLFNYSWKNGFGIFMFVEKLDYEFWFKLAAKCWMCVMNWCRYSISILAGHVFVAIWCLAEATKN